MDPAQRATLSLTLTVPPGMKAAASGQRQQETTLPGGRLLPMLIDDLISPLVQLTLALPQARERARVR